MKVFLLVVVIIWAIIDVGSRIYVFTLWRKSEKTIEEVNEKEKIVNINRMYALRQESDRLLQVLYNRFWSILVYTGYIVYYIFGW